MPTRFTDGSPPSSNAMWGWIAGAVVMALAILIVFSQPKPTPPKPAPVTYTTPTPAPEMEAEPERPAARRPVKHVRAKRPVLLPAPAADICEAYHPRALCRFFMRYGF